MGEKTTIRLPAVLKEQLQQEADRKGYTIKDLIMFIFGEHVHSSTVQG